MPWKDNVPPLPPTGFKISTDSAGVHLMWNKPAAASDGDTAYQFVVYRFMGGNDENLKNPENILKIISGGVRKYTDTSAIEGISYEYIVSSLDRLHNESKNNPAVVKMRNN